MKRILFVIPDLGVGGTNPSLEALYNQIKSIYSVNVFAISHQPRSREFLFDPVLMPQCKGLSCLYTDFEKQHGLDKLLAFLYKSIGQIAQLFGFDFKKYVGRKCVKQIESSYSFDSVVAFQEGFATKFVSLFENKHKIAWVHCNYDKWLPKGLSEDTLYSLFTHIVCVSNYTVSVFASRYPSLSRRTVGIHNFVEKEQIIHLSNKTVDDIRFNNKSFTILSAGRFHSVKRFREIPKIAARLREHSLDFRWYIIGNKSDITEMTLFNDNCQKYNVSDYVIWLGEKSNPYPYFRASDLFVCTSESEACPMVFIESKILGLPIVTTNFPSSFEFIENRVNGIIATLNELPDAIHEMMTKNSLYSSIKESIQKTSSDNTQLLSKIEELFSSEQY